MITAIFSRLAILVFGTLYPAYASYKAVRTKNVKEYVKWMMYWIVFAFFTCIETFTDIFLSWLPLYYEVKVIVVLWLLNPATKGSSVLYRKFVHPMLTRREQEIDEYLNQAKERGYTAVIQLGSKGVNYATNVIMQTALKTFGQGPLQQLDQRRLMLATSRSENAISSRYTGGSTRGAATHNTAAGVDHTDGCSDPINPNGMPRSQSLNMQSTSVFEFQDEYLYQGSSDDERFIISEQIESYDDFNENFGERLSDDVPVVVQGAARSRVLPKRKTRSSSVPTKNGKQQNAAASSSDSNSNTNNKKQTANSSKYAIKGRRRLRDSSDSNIDVD